MSKPCIDFITITKVGNTTDHTDIHNGAGFIKEAVGYEGEWTHEYTNVNDLISNQQVSDIYVHRLTSADNTLASDDLMICFFGFERYEVHLYTKQLLDFFGGKYVEMYKANIGYAVRASGYNKAFFDKVCPKSSEEK